MSGIDAVVIALGQLLNHWYLLGIVIAGQLLHELAHFIAARGLRAEAVIVIRLTTPMRVVYDDSGLSAFEESIIGLAPTLVGLTAALAWLAMAGWPEMSPLAIAATVAWVLFTLPSRDDTSEVGKALGLDEPIPEPQRSMLITFGALAVAAWLPTLPLNPMLMQLLAYSLMVASLGYFSMALYQHGLPGPESEADGSVGQ